MNRFVLLRNAKRTAVIAKIGAFLAKLPAGKSWAVEVSLHKTKRSLSQNAYLWGVAYKTILAADALQGWTAEDLHDYFLGEHFGWERIKGFGIRRVRPIRRSRKLSTLEFMDFVAFIQQRMAEHGLYVPDPNEYRGVSS